MNNKDETLSPKERRNILFKKFGYSEKQREEMDATYLDLKKKEEKMNVSYLDIAKKMGLTEKEMKLSIEEADLEMLEERLEMQETLRRKSRCVKDAQLIKKFAPYLEKYVTYFVSAIKNNQPYLIKKFNSDRTLQLRDKCGRTQLHHAVLNRRREIFHILIDMGADPQARDNNDCRPLDLFAIDWPDSYKSSCQVAFLEYATKKFDSLEELSVEDYKKKVSKTMYDISQTMEDFYKKEKGEQDIQ